MERPSKIVKATPELDKTNPENFDTLIAGFKVVDKAGGPELVVIGFLTNLPSIKDFYLFGDELRYNSPSYQNTTPVFQKVIFNREKLTYYKFMEKKNDQNDDFVSNFIFFRTLLTEKKDLYRYRDFCDSLYFLCKYWNDRIQDFQYFIKLPNEVRIIPDDNTK